MKLFKKVSALLVALIMGLGTVSVYAENNSSATDRTGSITIKNPTTSDDYSYNVTYYALQIFEVTYSADRVDPGDENDTVVSTGYSYTISSTSPWYDAVSTYASTQDSGLTLTAVAGQSTEFVVTISDGFSAAKFAEALREVYVLNLTDTSDSKKNFTKYTFQPQSNGSLKASDLPLGYYLVLGEFTTGEGDPDKTQVEAFTNLTTTNPDVEIEQKNEIKFEKTDNKDDVEIGETVNYTIAAKVENVSGYSSYTYKITDKMTEGLTFNKDVANVISLRQELYKFLP